MHRNAFMIYALPAPSKFDYAFCSYARWSHCLTFAFGILPLGSPCLIVPEGNLRSAFVRGHKRSLRSPYIYTGHSSRQALLDQVHGMLHTPERNCNNNCP